MYTPKIIKPYAQPFILAILIALLLCNCRSASQHTSMRVSEQADSVSVRLSGKAHGNITSQAQTQTDINGNKWKMCIRDRVTAAGSFTFVEGGSIKQPIYLYSTEGEVEYKAEPQGEVDGISFKQTLGFFFPGNTPGMHAFNAMVKNTRGYYIFEDSEGNQMILGQPGLTGSLSPSFNGGKARGDRRGTTYTVTADSNYSAIFLATPIDMEVIGGNKPAPAPQE